MIDYIKAQKILINSKINIKNEIILANNSINRISAKNIYSPTNYPAGNNTAFDGYAINSKETSRASTKNINVSYDDIDPFFNINTKEDLIEAEKILKNYKHD